jgi:hypothetical protein
VPYDGVGAGLHIHGVSKEVNGRSSIAVRRRTSAMANAGPSAMNTGPGKKLRFQCVCDAMNGDEFCYCAGSQTPTWRGRRRTDAAGVRKRQVTKSWPWSALTDRSSELSWLEVTDMGIEARSARALPERIGGCELPILMVAKMGAFRRHYSGFRSY